jgi:predicted branched-subunit amino acid permease
MISGSRIHKPASSVQAGIRAALPLVLPTLLLGVSFGVVARPVIGAAAAIVMSVAIFSGGAQFASVSVLAAGGSVITASLAGILVKARWLAMGFALGPSLPGGRIARAAQAQALVDASFVIAGRGDGTFDRDRLIGATIPQVGSWITGTIVGVTAGQALGDPRALGFDAVFVAFYLYLLNDVVDAPGPAAAAAVGAAVSLATLPFTPPGVSVIAASPAALIGLRPR